MNIFVSFKKSEGTWGYRLINKLIFDIKNKPPEMVASKRTESEQKFEILKKKSNKYLFHFENQRVSGVTAK